NPGYDMSHFTWIGAVTKDVGLCIAWGATPFKTIDDVKKKSMVVAGTGAGSETDTWPVVLNDGADTEGGRRGRKVPHRKHLVTLRFVEIVGRLREREETRQKGMLWYPCDTHGSTSYGTTGRRKTSRSSQARASDRPQSSQPKAQRRGVRDPRCGPAWRSRCGESERHQALRRAISRPPR